MFAGDEYYDDDITSGLTLEETILLTCPDCGDTDEAPLDFVGNGGRRRCVVCWREMLPSN